MSIEGGLVLELEIEIFAWLALKETRGGEEDIIEYNSKIAR